MLESRVGMNEESVDTVMNYFREARAHQDVASKQVYSYNKEAMLETLKNERLERIRQEQENIQTFNDDH